MIFDDRINIVTATDSYKLGHWQQYPKGTTGVYSYLEARTGDTGPQETVFFGLQPLLERIRANAVRYEDVDQAFRLARDHFGRSDLFNFKGWSQICEKHAGRLPLRIKAVAEGTVMPRGNVLMTVENTDPDAYWLTNAMESYLLHVWYPITVASLSRDVKVVLADALKRSGASLDGLPFMLHDFGYRGASSHEVAATGGAAHLVNFMGTDTVPALLFAARYYEAEGAAGFSIPATEHSIMTALGREGEFDQVQRALDAYPTGLVSIVADSFDYYNFVDKICSNEFHDQICSRDGKVVVRPDSVTDLHPTPGALMVWTLEKLWYAFGGTTNQKGFRVLDPHVGVIWGDGIDPRGIQQVVSAAMLAGFSAENLVFGMGGGLLQKVNRDTMRFAFKSSAQRRDGEWHDIQKWTIDPSKRSKKGRLGLYKDDGEFYTAAEHMERSDDILSSDDLLRTVFENGMLKNRTTFADVRERAAL